MFAVEISNLNAYFGEKQILKNISMVVEENDVVAIIGPSGCGKSTLVRCINRMHELVDTARVSGKIVSNDVNIYDPAVSPVKVRRRVGMVFQRPNPFPHMSIAENVVSGFNFTGTKIQSRQETIERALRDVALWDEVADRLDTPATTLSGGQQQRLCIARAIATKPEILLMDEPCSALDPIATARIEELIHELKEQYTIIMVTHNMQQASRVSNKTAFLLSGLLIEYDDTKKIFTNPSNPKTEEYITGRFG